jgi:hypothetical protein
MTWIFKQTERHEFGGLWTVGYYTPDGEWHPESDHDTAEAAAERVHWLNGGATASAIPEPEPVR